MKKTKLPILLSLLALPLVSCDETDVIDSSLDEMSETPSVSTDSSSDDSADEEGWPGDYIAEFFKETAGYEGIIPTPSEELAEGRTFEVVEYTDYDAYGNEAPSLAIIVSGDFTAFGDEAVEQGWVEPSRTAYDNARLINSPDLVLEMLILNYDETEDDNTYVYIQPSITGYTALYPEAAIEKAMGVALGEVTALPGSGLEGGTLYYLNLAGVSYGYFDFSAYGIDPEQYKVILEDEGFIYNPVGSPNYSYVYISPDIAYYVEIQRSYYSVYGCLYMQISLVDRAFYTDMDEFIDVMDEDMHQMGDRALMASIPSFDFDWDLIYLDESYLTSYNYVYFYVFTYGDDGSYVSNTEAINAVFEASEDWFYSSQVYGYIDSRTYSIYVSVTDITSSGYGTRIVVQGGDYLKYR